MRKKDYELIASQIKWTSTAYGYGDSERNAVRQVAHELANVFEQEYPKFDRQKFLTACGIFVTEEGNVISVR